ncbi:MAG: ABC transporter permease subunit [Dehalococcoidia bacterium]|nr:ABC transporter permease subunit [Dehalococcoidia bacterium]
MSGATTVREPAVRLDGLPRTRSAWGSFVRFATRKPLGFAGLCILVAMGLAAAFAPIVAPYGYDEFDFARALEGPSRDFFLGTDHLGRDVFSRAIWGTRVSLGVSLAAVFLAQAAAASVAIVSGFYGGWVDKIVQRLVDIWIALPTLVILITLIAIVGPGVKSMILIVAATIAPNYARLIRSVVLQVREEPYVEAAQAIGVSNTRVMLRYILPNVAHVIIYSATVALGAVILIVASLGFLGYGLPPPQPDLGAMLSGDGLEFMRRQSMLAIVPGVAITLIVFSFNIFGDALRDALDPRLRGR